MTAEKGKLDGFPWISHLADRFALLLARMKHDSNRGMHRAPDLMCGTSCLVPLKERGARTTALDHR